MPIYEKHFGLMETPFSITPDPRYLYMSDQHREALAHLMYGIQSDGGFVMLTGEVGTGKTTICRCLLEQLPQDCVVAYVVNPKMTVQELLSVVCDEFRIEYPRGNKSIKVFIDLLNAYLLDAHAGGRKAVLIIDEAQNLSRDVLEQIRLLTNLETEKRKLLQIILLGQPELREKLAKPELRQLSQRIIARYHLGPLTRKEVALYVSHRLIVAGSNDGLFSSSALSEVFRHSRGIPRLVNVICDRALLGAYTQGKIKVDSKTVTHAAREVFGEPAKGRLKRPAVLGWYVAGLLAFGICTAYATAWHYGFDARSLWSNTASSVKDETTTLAQQRKPVPQVNAVQEVAQTAATGANDKVSAQSIGEPAQPESLQSPQGAPGSGDSTPKAAPAKVEAPAQATAPIGKLAEICQTQGQDTAHQVIFRKWGATFRRQDSASACGQAEAQGLQCFSGKGGIEELRKWNRPAVLKLFDADGKEFHASVVAIEGKAATFAAGDETVSVAMDDMLAAWRGEFTLLWRAPPRYSGTLQTGSSGATVSWLKSQLAHVRGETTEPSNATVFDDALAEEVKHFQAANGLAPDGIVGPQTLIRLILEANSDAPVLMEKKKGS